MSVPIKLLSGLLSLCLVSPVTTFAQSAGAARIVSVDFKSPTDCTPQAICKTLKVGDVVQVSGKILMGGRDFAVASAGANKDAISILMSHLAFDGGVESVPPSNMPVIKPSPGAAKSAVVITPDADVDYK